MLAFHTEYGNILCMIFSFVQLPRFASKWEKHRLNDEDLQVLKELIRRNPDAGVVMRGTGGLRKLRFAPLSRHTGKSGAFRVGYVYFRVASTVYFFALIAKKDQQNLTTAECGEVKKLIEAIEKMYRSQHRKE